MHDVFILEGLFFFDCESIKRGDPVVLSALKEVLAVVSIN